MRSKGEFAEALRGERTQSIADFDKPLSAADATQAAPLHPLTDKYLRTAHTVAQVLENTALDWSPAIIALCKAVENELVMRLFEPLRQKTACQPFSFNLGTRTLNSVGRYLTTSGAYVPSFIAISNFLYVAGVRPRATSLTRAFIDSIQESPQRHWLLAGDGLPDALTTLATDYRNNAAHSSELSAEDFRACKALVALPGGILARLAQTGLAWDQSHVSGNSFNARGCPPT